MYIENSIHPAQSSALHSCSTNVSQDKETFRDIFQRMLDNRSNSRRKVELTGILIPCYHERNRRTYRYKLGTDSNEYFLYIGDSLVELAKMVAWDEVTVKGHLDLDSHVLDVEKINLVHPVEPVAVAVALPMTLREPTVDLDNYRKIIAQRGKIEPSYEDLAS